MQSEKLTPIKLYDLAFEDEIKMNIELHKQKYGREITAKAARPHKGDQGRDTIRKWIDPDTHPRLLPEEFRPAIERLIFRNIPQSDMLQIYDDLREIRRSFHITAIKDIFSTSIFTVTASFNFKIHERRIFFLTDDQATVPKYCFGLIEIEFNKDIVGTATFYGIKEQANSLEFIEGVSNITQFLEDFAWPRAYGYLYPIRQMDSVADEAQLILKLLISEVVDPNAALFPSLEEDGTNLYTGVGITGLNMKFAVEQRFEDREVVHRLSLLTEHIFDDYIIEHYLYWHDAIGSKLFLQPTKWYGADFFGNRGK